MNRKVKRRRRKKLREQKNLNLPEKAETIRPIVVEDLLVKIAVEELKQYTHYIKSLKEDHFNQTRIIRLTFASDKDSLFATTIQQYLDEAIPETNRRLGTVNEKAIMLILLDTPITPEMFSLVRPRYEQYLS